MNYLLKCVSYEAKTEHLSEFQEVSNRAALSEKRLCLFSEGVVREMLLFVFRSTSRENSLFKHLFRSCRLMSSDRLSAVSAAANPDWSEELNPEVSFPSEQTQPADVTLLLLYRLSKPEKNPLS